MLCLTPCLRADSPARVVLLSNEGRALTLHTLPRTYQAASAHCGRLGGTLASARDAAMEATIANVRASAMQPVVTSTVGDGQAHRCRAAALASEHQESP